MNAEKQVHKIIHATSNFINAITTTRFLQRSVPCFLQIIVILRIVYLYLILLFLSVAALPIMLETLSNKILEHIAQQCLVCYDTGVPCAARQVCDDPLSLIFPFQVSLY